MYIGNTYSIDLKTIKLFSRSSQQGVPKYMRGEYRSLKYIKSKKLTKFLNSKWRRMIKNGGFLDGKFGLAGNEKYNRHNALLLIVYTHSHTGCAYI